MARVVCGGVFIFLPALSFGDREIILMSDRPVVFVAAGAREVALYVKSAAGRCHALMPRPLLLDRGYAVKRKDGAGRWRGTAMFARGESSSARPRPPDKRPPRREEIFLPPPQSSFEAEVCT